MEWPRDMANDNRRMRKDLEEAHAEIGRLRAAIQRIDGINDNPSDYNPEINAVCDTILRPHS